MHPPSSLSLLKQLDNCEIFYFSVAFVTTSGVATIINKLQELEKRNIKGQILVSQYLNFSQPEALKRLLKFTVIRLKFKANNISLKSSRKIGISSLSVLSHHRTYRSVYGGSLIYSFTFR